MTDTPLPEIVTEADAIATLAQAAADPNYDTVNGRKVLWGSYPQGWDIHVADLEDLEPAPHRKRGAVHVRDTDGLLAYLDLQMGTLDDHGGAAVDRLPVVYYDPEKFSAVAVLNGHTDAGPGWGDHRAELQLQATPEWQAWAAIDRRFLPATEFAEFIEEWRHTIADPPTGDLLDMVRSFRATTKVAFRQEVVDKSGARALEYVEETAATAGSKGQLEIPDGFGLVLAPFVGADPKALPARFRYRLSEGRVSFGVVLEQPAQVAKAAFDAELARIGQHAPFVLINGRP